MATQGETTQGETTQARPRNRVLPSAESVRSVGGLIAVAVGVVAVSGLAIVTMALVDGNKEAANTLIPLTTSAFGVISAVVGAYLGIKIGTDQSKGLAEEVSSAHSTIAAVQALVPSDKHDELQQALRKDD